MMRKSDSYSRSGTLETDLSQFTREGGLYEKLGEGKIRCFACAHRCLIPRGRPGICRVRFNEDGLLKVPFGYTAGLCSDPIEKKPFFHVLPGSHALSFGMLGCDLHCAYCQNWITSQVIRDEDARGTVRGIGAVEIVDLAMREKARVVTSTYNEPLITTEWAVEIFRLAKAKGLYTSYVSNGNGTPEVIEYLRPWIDAYKVDLKSFQDSHYRQLGGTLESVLRTIRQLKETGIWVEIVTLLVPSFNDSEEELREMARFLKSLDPAMPWHITAFHEDYKMHGMGNTSLRSLLRAGSIGKEEGLSYVYLGNVAGYAPEWENTSCHHCGALLIERCGFRVRKNRMAKGKCPDCGTSIPGIWE